MEGDQTAVAGRSADGLRPLIDKARDLQAVIILIGPEPRNRQGGRLVVREHGCGNRRLVTGVSPGFKPDPAPTIEGQGKRAAITDRQNCRIGCRKPLIHRDPIVDQKPGGAGQVHLRHGPNPNDDRGDQKRFAIAQREKNLGSLVCDRSNTRAEPENDAVILMQPLHPLRDGGIHPACQNPRLRFDDGDGAAMPPGSRCNLQADEPRTKNSDGTARHERSPQSPRLPHRSEIMNVGNAVSDGEFAGLSTRCQHQPVIGKPCTVGEFDRC